MDFAYRKTPTSRSSRTSTFRPLRRDYRHIGGTGAKTSLVSLISRLYDVTAGQVPGDGRVT
ncbi:MAG: hypothetical protein ACLS43_13290 [Evtepia gabavorous]